MKASIILNNNSYHFSMSKAQNFERIYVGGLEPPRLKASEVVGRLRLLDGIEIKSVDADDANSFLHLNAQSLQENRSAFEIISKNYNNVKWKGCKLKIQIAKLPFLQRLEQERHEHEKQRVTTLEESAIKPIIVSNPKLPRHLRIRQGFGLEAWRVDTKPCKTMDWENFDKILIQLRKRRQRQTRFVKGSKTKAFYSRGVHLIFSEKNIKISQQIREHFTAPGCRVQTASCASESQEENEIDETPYEWSSDSSTTEQERLSQIVEVHESDGSTVVTSESSINVTITQEDSSLEKLCGNREESSSSQWDRIEKLPRNSEDSDSEKEGLKNGVDKRVSTLPIGREPSYEWSSDEEDTDQTEDYSPKQSNSQEEEDADDLTNDVASNLEILRNIFPEMKHVTPNEIEKNPLIGNSECSLKINNIQRYDPANKYAQLCENERIKNNWLKAYNYGDNATGWNSSVNGSESSDDPKNIDVNVNKDDILNSAIATTKQKAPYEWSSDDENSKPDQSGDDSSLKQMNSQVEKFDFDDLKRDVASNLGILRDLFPEMKDVKLDEVEKNHPTNNLKSSWNIDSMQRYDPAKKCIQVPEDEESVHECSKAESDDEDSETGGGFHDTHDCETREASLENAKSATEANDEDVKNIYHESKLEEVFRIARTSGEGGGFQVSSIIGDQADECKNKESISKEDEGREKGAFSFSFQLPTPPKITTKLSDSNQLVKCRSDQSLPGTARVGDEGGSGSDGNSIHVGVTSNRRRGFMPADKVLDCYYKKFFELNDGLSIIQDPKKFLTDEVVKRKWDEERKALTQDWKRKRKYAQTRIERNNKFRR